MRLGCLTGTFHYPSKKISHLENYDDPTIVIPPILNIPPSFSSINSPTNSSRLIKDAYIRAILFYIKGNWG